MRVALVSGYNWQVFGGVQHQVRDLARALQEAGETVRLVCPGSPPGAASSEEGLIEATGKSLPVPVNGSRAPVAPGPVSMARTIGALKAFVPDVVHVHEPLLPGPPLAALLGSPAPVVATFHRAGSDRLYRAAGRLLAPIALKKMAAVTVVSPAARQTAEEALGGHLEAIEIPNGVDLDRLAAKKRDEKGPFKDAAGPVVCFLGRLEARKGVGLLLDATGLLAEPPQVLVVGDGPERAALEEKAAGRAEVSFLGALGDEEAAEVLARADCFVAPAIEGESFGIVILEAMAAGTAVVASDIAGYRVAAGGAARLFASGEAGGLAEALGQVLSDRGERERLVEAGRRRAAECSITTVSASYLELYRSVAARSRPGIDAGLARRS